MKRYFKQIDVGKPEKRVSQITLRAIVENASGAVTVTDFMLQDGVQLTGHIPATREMLRKLRESGQPAAPKHFNAVIRGRKTVIIPNRGAYWSVVLGTPVVTTALDITGLARTGVPAGMRYSHFYRTRQFVYGKALVAGDTFEFLASKRRVAHNGTPTGYYTGFYHQCAAGNARFNVELMAEGATIRPQPSVGLLIEIQEWELAGGGRRL